MTEKALILKFVIFQEDFLRQGVKEFPFQESQLFKILVMNFSKCKNYGQVNFIWTLGSNESNRSLSSISCKHLKRPMLKSNWKTLTLFQGVPASEYINQAFNGQKGFKDKENCEACGNENAEKKCSNCEFGSRKFRSSS